MLPYNPYVNESYGETYHLHLRVEMSRGRNQRAAGAYGLHDAISQKTVTSLHHFVRKLSFSSFPCIVVSGNF
jgi:hypothetical protein